MHIEKNVCSILFKTLTNIKKTKDDSYTQRHEMEKMGIMKELWIMEGTLVKKPLWIFTKKEYRNIVDMITSIWTPRGYGSFFQYKFVDGKIRAKKTHKYHNLLLHILLIVVRGTLTVDIWNIIYMWNKLFQ